MDVDIGCSMVIVRMLVYVNLAAMQVFVCVYVHINATYCVGGVQWHEVYFAYISYRQNILYRHV